MIPTLPTDYTQLGSADDGRPRYFLDDTIDDTLDGDWWLDLGRVDLPPAPAV